jgi:Cu-Zn family superoxide dismutase
MQEPTPQADASTPFASATLRDASGTPIGRVQFYDVKHHTTVKVRLTANAHVTAEQFHGFHIHTGTDTASGTSGCIADATKASSTWFVSAGGHLKADGQIHSQHTGDLQSLLVAQDGSTTST